METDIRTEEKKCRTSIGKEQQQLFFSDDTEFTSKTIEKVTETLNDFPLNVSANKFRKGLPTEYQLAILFLAHIQINHLLDKDILTGQERQLIQFLNSSHKLYSFLEPYRDCFFREKSSIPSSSLHNLSIAYSYNSPIFKLPVEKLQGVSSQDKQLSEIITQAKQGEIVDAIRAVEDISVSKLDFNEATDILSDSAARLLALANSDPYQRVAHVLSYIAAYPHSLNAAILAILEQYVHSPYALVHQVKANPEVITEACRHFGQAYTLLTERHKTIEALELLAFAVRFVAAIDQIDPSLTEKYPPYREKLADICRSQAFMQPQLADVYLSTLPPADLLNLSPGEERSALRMVAISLAHKGKKNLNMQMQTWALGKLKEQSCRDQFFADWVQARIGTAISPQKLSHQKQQEREHYVFSLDNGRAELTISYNNKITISVDNSIQSCWYASDTLLQENLARITAEPFKELTIDADPQHPGEYIIAKHGCRLKRENGKALITKELVIEGGQRQELIYAQQSEQQLAERYGEVWNNEYRAFIGPESNELLIFCRDKLLYRVKNEPVLHLQRISDGAVLSPPAANFLSALGIGIQGLLWGRLEGDRFIPTEIEGSAPPLRLKVMNKKEGGYSFASLDFLGYSLATPETNGRLMRPTLILQNDRGEQRLFYPSDKGWIHLKKSEEGVEGGDFADALRYATILATQGNFGFLTALLEKVQFSCQMTTEETQLIQEAVLLLENHAPAIAIKLLLLQHDNSLQYDEQASLLSSKSCHQLFLLYRGYVEAENLLGKGLLHREDERLFVIALKKNAQREEDELISRWNSAKGDYDRQWFYDRWMPSKEWLKLADHRQQIDSWQGGYAAFKAVAEVRGASLHKGERVGERYVPLKQVYARQLLWQNIAPKDTGSGATPILKRLWDACCARGKKIDEYYPNFSLADIFDSPMKGEVLLEAYRLIREGSEEEKNRLVELIAFNGDKSAEMAWLVSVAASPAKYPTIEQIKQWEIKRVEWMKGQIKTSAEEKMKLFLEAPRDDFSWLKSFIKEYSYRYYRGMGTGNNYIEHDETEEALLKLAVQDKALAPDPEAMRRWLTLNKVDNAAYAEIIAEAKKPSKDPRIIRRQEYNAVLREKEEQEKDWAYYENRAKKFEIKEEEVEQQNKASWEGMFVGTLAKIGALLQPIFITLSVFWQIKWKIEESLDISTGEVGYKRQWVKPVSAQAVRAEDSLQTIGSILQKTDTAFNMQLDSWQGFLHANNGINNLVGALTDTEQRYSKQLKIREQTLLLQANSARGSEQKLQQLIEGKVVDWERLQKMIYKGRADGYQKQLADPTAWEALENGFLQYLVERTQHIQLGKILKAASKVKKATRKLEQLQKAGDQEKVKAVQDKLIALHRNLKILLGEKRAYEPSRETRSLLLFEVAAQGFYREEQLKKLSEFTKEDRDPVQLAEMRTGLGKSEWILPSLVFHIPTVQQMQAQESERLKGPAHKLIENIWPATQAKSNTESLRQKLWRAFSKRVVALFFNRAMHFNANQLDRLAHRAEEAQRKGIPFSLTADVIHSIKLHFLETLSKLDESPEDRELQQQVTHYITILRQQYTNAFAAVDESLAAFDPRNITIYSLGKAEPLEQYRVAFGCFIFGKLPNMDEIKAAMKAHKPRSAEETKALVDAVVNNLFPDLYLYFGIQDGQKEEFRNFLLGKTTLEPGWLKGNRRLQEIYLAKGYVTVVIDACLKGRVGVNYGLSKMYLDICKHAIPYEKKDCPKETKNKNSSSPAVYQNPDETFLKTLFTYYDQGLDNGQLRELADHLFQLYKKNCDRYVLPNNSYAYKVIQQCLGGAGIIPQTHSAEKLYAQLCAHQATVKNREGTPPLGLVEAYVTCIVAPKIEQYPYSLCSTPQDIINIFPESLSVSATPQCKEAHSAKTVLCEMPEMRTMKKKMVTKQGNSVRKIETVDAGKIIEQVAKQVKADPTIRALIDPSALLIGPSAREIAKQFARALQGTTIKRVLFRDPDTKVFVTMDVNNPEGPLGDYHAGQHKPRTTFTLYEQQDAFATDIVQKEDTTAFVLVGKQTTLSEGYQGCGRLRQIDGGDGGQKVCFLVDPEIENVDDCEALYAFMEKNEKQAMETMNGAAIRRLMDADLHAGLVCKILGLPIGDVDAQRVPSASEALQNFRASKPFFKRGAGLTPEMLYRSIGDEISGEEQLNNHHKSVEREISQHKNLSRQEKHWLHERLKKHKWSGIPLAEKERQTANMGVCAETLQEIQVQQQVQQEQMVAIELEPKSISSTIKKKYSWSNSVESFYTDNWHKIDATTIRAKLLRSTGASQWLRGKINKLENKQVSASWWQRPWLWLRHMDLSVRLTNLKKELNQLRVQDLLRKEVSFSPIGQLIDNALPPGMQGAARFFSPNFLCSSNFAEQRAEGLVAPFGSRAFPIDRVLIIQDETASGEKEYTIIAVNANDTTTINKLFEDEKTAKNVNYKRKIALYDRNTKQIHNQGKNKFNEEELSNITLQGLLQEADIFAGVTALDAAEETLRTNIKRIRKKREDGRDQLPIDKKSWSIFVNMYVYFLPEEEMRLAGWQHLDWAVHLSDEATTSTLRKK